MSIQAISAALLVDVENPTRKLVLIGHADHAHADGTASWAATATISLFANCDARTVQRHTVWLVEHGYLREGDQQLVAHFRADHRPIVYDVALTGEQRQEWADNPVQGGRRDTATAAGAKGGPATHKSRVDNLSPREDGPRGDNPSLHGVTVQTPRGDRGVTQTVLEPSLNQSQKISTREQAALIPEPTTPGPSGRSSRRAPERPLPQDWLPNDSHGQYAREHQLDIIVEQAKFRAHAETHDRRARSWDGAFRTWLLKAVEYRVAAPATYRPQDDPWDSRYEPQAEPDADPPQRTTDEQGRPYILDTETLRWVPDGWTIPEGAVTQ